MRKYLTKMEDKRKRMGMTQMDLAYKAKVGFADISRFENLWAKPYSGQAERLSKVLNLPADELTKEVENDGYEKNSMGTIPRFNGNF